MEFAIVWFVFAGFGVAALRIWMPYFSGWKILQEEFDSGHQSPGTFIKSRGLILIRFNYLRSSSAVSLSLYSNGLLFKPRFLFSFFLGRDLFIPVKAIQSYGMNTSFSGKYLKLLVLNQDISIHGPMATEIFNHLEQGD